MPPLPADSIHARACKLKCEKILTRPIKAAVQVQLQIHPYFRPSQAEAPFCGAVPGTPARVPVGE